MKTNEYYAERFGYDKDWVPEGGSVPSYTTSVDVMINEIERQGEECKWYVLAYYSESLDDLWKPAALAAALDSYIEEAG
jgi:hypothetical protein